MATPDMLEPFLDFTEKSDGPPDVRFVQAWWPSYMAIDIKDLTAGEREILVHGGRADKMLSIVKRSPSFLDYGQRGLAVLIFGVTSWSTRQLSHPTGDNQRVLWEALPTCYSGPVTICAKDGHIAEGGEIISGTLMDWSVQEDGSGKCKLMEYPKPFTFQVEDLIAGTLVKLQNINLAPGSLPQEPAVASG
ncbi:uncharacterized protein Z520_11741 [Fonsecaea multimorphosa CBS 102226]|uniref:Uncharacterized protein n=1 Tax=Fonsecaea multimorphosa CBS 102226 TaxID=1442371 RepID=A0A0D2GSW1_9EURO|nr:uncharacterized protein Z520_11741 [Fonsecaea multimorphosa CBS 102226]KIX92565.1 hypothetical protein Z520_11741 [Fonsecaea multimorphosa CBS 102226]OAL17830.1 hypothetical protein AYO22_11257 [Fonsecaea multimorphosa]